MPIIELHFLLASLSMSLTARDPRAHNRRGEDGERASQVSKCHRRTSSRHKHTPCFFGDTSGTIYTYIMRLSGRYCRLYTLPRPAGRGRTKLKQHIASWLGPQCCSSSGCLVVRSCDSALNIFLCYLKNTPTDSSIKSERRQRSR